MIHAEAGRSSVSANLRVLPGKPQRIEGTNDPIGWFRNAESSEPSGELVGVARPIGRGTRLRAPLRLAFPFVVGLAERPEFGILVVALCNSESGRDVRRPRPIQETGWNAVVSEDHQRHEIVDESIPLSIA